MRSISVTLPEHFTSTFLQKKKQKKTEKDGKNERNTIATQKFTCI